METINIPTNCPTCGSILVRVKDQLFCENNACEAKSSKKLVHFAKTMKILGLGEKTLEKLELNGIPDLYTLSQFDMVEKLGDKIGNKIFNEIEKSKNATLGTFIASMSIPLIGKSAADKLQSQISSLDMINEDVCKKAGLGPAATKSMMNWVNNEYQNYKTLPLNFTVLKAEVPKLKVCISGKINGYTKTKIAELLSSHNVEVKDNVTKDVDYLITEETNTTKVNKAKEYNITIISLESFLKEIN